MLFFISIKQVEFIMNDLSPIEIEPQTPAKHSIIWLHGLGADGNDFVPIVNQLKLPTELAVRFIFPHAPIIPVTINNGYKMRAWFDILSLSIDSNFDSVGFSNAIKSVTALIDREIARGIPSEKIVLAGFSQGATLALATALAYGSPLSGVIALSGFLPKNLLTSKQSHSLPIFLAHGSDDAIVPYVLGKMTYQNLSEAGFSPNWHSYPMPHSVCLNEIEDMSAWIKKIWL